MTGWLGNGGVKIEALRDSVPEHMGEAREPQGRYCRGILALPGTTWLLGVPGTGTFAASLYEAFPPAEAARIRARFEFHFTP